MIEGRNVSIHIDDRGQKIVVIHDIRFKGKRRIDWEEVKEYLKQYIGDYYEIEESAEKIYIGSKLPHEFCGSESRKSLMGAVAKAKANAATCIPEMIKIATNTEFKQNEKEKHNQDAKYGWYKYDVHFAIPICDDGSNVNRYNVYKARLLVNHASNGKKYLYDILGIKKETSKPQQ